METYGERVQALLRALTLEEKVALLAGASMWYTTPVERLGSPAIKVTDGPNGARGDGLFGSGTSAACFPAGIALAATWNVELVEQVGQALAEESQTKGAVVLLGPTVNIHRSPLNGRNFECFSEDPYLAARLAVAYITALQSRGVGASVKHYAGNNSEFERNTISSEIGERPLREIYLPAFEAATREAGSWTVMAAYNRLHGTFCCEHPELLTRILRDEWGVDACGRLPQTFPRRLQDNPAYINYPGENGKVVYGEGIFVGYRYYDKKQIPPLFPFGFGLSYTSFDYAGLRLSKSTVLPDETLDVTVEVRNSGTRAGVEVVQLYVRDPQAAVLRPEKELKGFAKVALQPGETRTVRLTLDRRALAYYDDAARRWVAEAGEFEALVGRSAQDIRLAAPFRLAQTVRFDGPGRAPARLTIESTVNDLLADDAARAIVDRHVPGFSRSAHLGFAQGFALAQLATFDAQTFDEPTLSAIAADLEKVEDG